MFLCSTCLSLILPTAVPVSQTIEIDRSQPFTVHLTADSPMGEASIREHSIFWHPDRRMYYLIADVVPLASSHHPNTYDTDIHLWSSPDLAHWNYRGVAVAKGKPPDAYDGYGVASPVGMAYYGGKLYVPFSARRTSRFDRRGIGLAWSGANPDQIPWAKSPSPISDLEGEDDDPAVLVVPGDPRLHLYHRRTGPGGYRIVHTCSIAPEQPESWPVAQPVVERPETVRAQELTGAFFAGGTIHLFIIEHLAKGGMKIAHVVSKRPDGPFTPVDPGRRYLSPQSQARGLVYSGHITPVVREGRLSACFWTVRQHGQRYGLLGHPARLTENGP